MELWNSIRSMEFHKIFCSTRPWNNEKKFHNFMIVMCYVMRL